MGVAEVLITFLKSTGFTEFFLPFLLFFAVIYATLDKTEVFGKEKRDVNAVIALAISLIAAATGWVVKAVSGFIPWLVFVIIIVIGILMAIALVFGNLENFQKNWGWFGKIAIVFISIILVLAAVYSVFPGFFSGGMGAIGWSDEDTAMMIILIALLAFFGVVTRKRTSGGSS